MDHQNHRNMSQGRNFCENLGVGGILRCSKSVDTLLEPVFNQSQF
jgi:hypothetical protein